MLKLEASKCPPGAKDCNGFFMVGIPYRGGGPMMQDLLGGQIPLMFINQDVALPHVKAGKLRALAVTSLQRNPLYPDVPTVAESGFPGFQALSWSGLSAIKGTPQPIVDKLEATLRKIMTSPEIRQRLESVGFVVPAPGAKAYTEFVKNELDLWTRVIKTAGIKPECRLLNATGNGPERQSQTFALYPCNTAHSQGYWERRNFVVSKYIPLLQQQR